jgi:hypothetical protein
MPDIADIGADVIESLYWRWTNMRRKPHLVCKEWLEDKHAFYRDMAPSYSKENDTLVRKDPDLEYSKKNCFWGTRKDVYAKFSRKVLYEYEGFCYEKQELAAKLGIAVPTLESRVKEGMVKKVRPYKDAESLNYSFKQISHAETKANKKDATINSVLIEMEKHGISWEVALKIIEPLISLL